MNVTRGQPLAYVSSPDFASRRRRLSQGADGLPATPSASPTATRRCSRTTRWRAADLEQAQSDVAVGRGRRRSRPCRPCARSASRNRRSRRSRRARRRRSRRSSARRSTAPSSRSSSPTASCSQAGTTPCFTVADLSTMWVMANVFANDLRRRGRRASRSTSSPTSRRRRSRAGSTTSLARRSGHEGRVGARRRAEQQSRAAPRHVRARADQVERTSISGILVPVVVGAARRSEPAVRLRRRRRQRLRAPADRPRLARRRPVRDHGGPRTPAIRSWPKARSSFSSRRASDATRLVPPREPLPTASVAGQARSDSAAGRSVGQAAAARRAPRARDHRRRHLLAPAPAGRRLSRRVAAAAWR